MKTVMIAAGGTGGHINPALAFASILQQEHPECRIVFVGSKDRMEAQLIPQKGYPFVGLEVYGTNGGLKQKLHSLRSLQKAEKQCLALLQKEKPTACIGFGSYISVPLIRAAHKLGIVTMIHEQNSYAGKANRFLARYADAIVGSYAENRQDFPAAKLRIFGNPEATAAVQEKQADLHAVYGFSREKPLLFFVMGSLGSSTVSAVLDEACGRLLPRAQILIAAGRSNDYTFRSQGEGLRIEEYVNGKAALKQADLCVSRAGATTLAEITALGAASILVPSPYVPNNHQYYNARRLADEQAAVLIEEKDLSAERLTETIETLLDHPEDLKRMRLNAAALGKPDAAYQMIDWMEELADARNAG